MKDSIYDMLNDVKTELSEYEITEMTETEKNVAKVNLRKVLKSKNNYKRYISIAAGVVICIGLIGASFNGNVYAGIKNIASDIASYLGIKNNLEDYKTVVGQSVTDKDITITLDEVLIDADQLIISSTATSNVITSDIGIFSMDGTVKINGKEMFYGSSGSSKMLDEYTSQTVMGYHVEEIDLKEDLDIKITFHSVFLEGKEIKGKWSFQFKANGKELAAHTMEIPITISFQLPNDCKIQLKEYTSNVIGPKLYFDIEGDIEYNIELRGKDDIGNPVVFYISHINNGKGVFELGTIDNGNLDEAASKLFLTPFAVEMPKESGRMNQDFQKIGEQFEINIK